MKDQPLPIWNHREIVGHASTVAGAARIIGQRIGIPAGFHLHVWRRLPIVCETQELPDGFVFSVSNLARGAA